MANILVVDDRATDRQFLVTLLNRQKHHLSEASDGAEALALVKSQRPDLVVTDILMPTMDGYEFVRQLRADPVVATTAVIFFTAHYHIQEAASLAKSCGVRHILTKPCDLALILRTVEESLSAPLDRNSPSLSQEFDHEHLRVITDKLSQTADELQIVSQRLAALVDVNLELASERDPHEFLKKVCPAARDLLGAQHAVLAVERGADKNDAFFVTSGMDAATAERVGRPALREGLIGSVFAERKSRRLTNIHGEAQAAGLPPNYPPVHSLLVAPIASLAHVYGWICLTNKIGAEEFSAEDERLLGMLAAQVGRIYENGSFYVEIQQHAARLEAEVDRRNRAQEALTESEKRFRQMAENIRDVFFLVDADSGRVLYINPAYEEIFGRSCDSLYANPESWTEAFHPDDRASTYEKYKQGMSTGTFEYQYRIVRPDGSIRWLETRGFPILDDAGRMIRITGVAEDITQRKETEDRVVHLNRVYAMLSGINALIVRVRDRDELFREACRIAVEEGGFRMSLICIVDQSTMKITPLASAGKDDELLSAITSILSTRASASTTMVARAIREKENVVSNVSQIDPNVLFGRKYTESGVRSMAVLPLIVSKEAVGVLALYASESEFFQEEELKLLTDLAGDVAFAIDHIDKQERLDYLAYYDALTGLANRSLFLERVAQCIRAAVSSGHKVALFLIDLERFKNINDSLGRATGDALLKQVAEWLKWNSGDANLLARLDADKFAAVLPQVRQDGDLARLLEKTIEAFLAHPFRVDETTLRLTAKVGIALFPEDGANADTLFKNAEAALKRAKRKGDRYLFYTQTMTETVAGKLTLENQLRQAIDREEFVLHYQPKVVVTSGKLAGAEALIRWNDPRTGLVPPGRFIPILEETGLIYEVGRWALRKAVEDHLRWRAEGLSPVRIAVNVSPLQLRHRRFIDEIEQAIELDAQAAAGLELEITENLIMEDVKHSIASLRTVRALGVSIAIDDFGTGFSSLSYLSKLPVDTLKIDQMFVNDITAGPEGLALVSTIVTLAHALKLKVVAEGVETEEQLQLLRALNCDEMQGFLFSKPVPGDIFKARFLTTKI